MRNAKMRKVGDSVMLAIPPALGDAVHLEAGSRVGIAIESGRFVVESLPRRYTLEELLAQCNPKAQRTNREREWLVSKPMGGEIV